jgi:hypothetical protein
MASDRQRGQITPSTSLRLAFLSFFGSDPIASFGTRHPLR